MKLKICASVAIAIDISTKLALAGESAFPQVTQLAKWSCHPPLVSYQGSFPGPTYDCFIAFPSVFADVPSLLIFEDEVPMPLKGPPPQNFLTPGAPMHNINPKTVTKDGFTITKLSNLTNGGRDYTYSGSWVAAGPGPLAARIVPKYIVLSVLYAPPGGPKGTNSIVYSQENTAGTSNSVSKSFTQGYSVSFEGSGGFFGADAGGGLGFSYSHEDSDKESFELEISKSSSISVHGYEGGDGVNNDYDEIVILPNPPIDIQLGIHDVLWTVAGNAPLPTRISVAWLKDPTLFQNDAPGVGVY
jgi:hypothetical protein